LKGKKFITGKNVSVADFTAAVTLLPLFQLTLDETTRKGLVDLTKWFEGVTKLPAWVSAAGKIFMCKQ
jgi:glutathione S-transferase